jgi:hypothetical protein
MQRANINKILIINIIILFFIVGACTHKPGKNSNLLIESDSIDSEIVNNGTIYKIPSPIELFQFMEQSGTGYNKDKLNNASQVDNYLSTYKKATNFGIYAADMAYCSVFGDYQETLLYFNATKKLAQELDLYNSFGEELANKINSNLVEVDSLIDISTQSYDDVTTYLEDQGMTDIQCLIVAGGWIESLYLCFSTNKNLKSNIEMSQRIVDQQILLENLINFLENNQHSTNVKNILAKLKDLQMEYDVLYTNNDKTIITQQQFANIANKVTEIRNEIVS